MSDLEKIKQWKDTGKYNKKYSKEKKEGKRWMLRSLYESEVKSIMKGCKWSDLYFGETVCRLNLEPCYGADDCTYKESING